MEFKYKIQGMHCTACVRKIKSVLSPHFKVIEVTLNPPFLKIDADKPPLLDELNKYISVAGNYSVSHDSEPPPAKENSEIGLSAYYPIFLIAAYIIGVASINNFHWNEI